MEKNNFDPVVLLMLFGIYFIIDFLVIYNVLELIYGIVLIVYYFRCRAAKKKVVGD